MASHKSPRAIDYSMLIAREVVGKNLSRRADTASTVGAVIGVVVCFIIVAFLCKIASRSSPDPLDNDEIIRRQQREHAYEVALQTLGERNRRNDDGVDRWEAHASHNLRTPPPAYGEGSGS
jgi:hypothetical protein